MATQIIVDNQWATVRYETDGDYVYHTVHQPISGEEFRQTLNTSLQTLKQNNAMKWLLENNADGHFVTDDMELALTNWGAGAAQAGWKYGALVLSKTMTGDISVTRVVDHFQKLGVQVGTFLELVEARQWLINQ